jgi:hypothetical protein
MFVRHKVQDYAKWRKVYDDFEETRTKMGETGDWVWQLAGDPNDVTVIHDFDSVEKAKAFVKRSELREAMGKLSPRSGSPTRRRPALLLLDQRD